MSDSTLYYFYSVGCGWCKKAEPLIDELNESGDYEILKLDLAEKDNQELNKQLKEKYKAQCGTPWLIDAETGHQICGFREKDIIEKWAKGEEIPLPPRPKSPPPKPPFHGATNKEELKWKKEYKKWLEENDHLPDNQKRSPDDILKMPRPKSDPPRPINPNSTDEQIETWKTEYTKWKDENDHLPNLQPADTIINRIMAQKNNSGQAPVNNAGISQRLKTIEDKLDKILKAIG